MGATVKGSIPGIERVAVIFDPDTAPHAIFLPVMETVAPQFEVTLIRAPVRNTAEIESAIGEGLKRAGWRAHTHA